MYGAFLPGEQIDTISPVNWLHPLNRGLKAWYFALPGFGGQRTWHDITSMSNGFHGTLTNKDPIADWGNVGGRPISYGSLNMNAGTEIVVIPGMPLIQTNKLTVSAWINPDVLTRGDTLTRWQNGGTGGDQFNLLYGLTSGKPQFFISDGTATDNSGVGANAMSIGTWHNPVGTWDTNDVKVYLDGLFQSSGISTKTISTAGGGADLRIGNEGGGSGPYNGQIDDVRLYDRALSADEVSALRLEALAGHPNTLNWFSYRRLTVGVGCRHLLAPRLSSPTIGNSICWELGPFS